MEKTVYIPNDSQFVYEILGERLIKTHRVLFSFEGKNAIVTDFSTILLEKLLSGVVNIKKSKIYKILHGS